MGSPSTTRRRRRREARREGPSALLEMLFVVLLVGWASGIARHDLPMRNHGLGTTCEGLPPFERLAPSIAESRRVVFVTEPPPEGSRDLFCAQHDLAPVPLERWFMPGIKAASQDLAATSVIIYLNDPAARAARIDELTTAAAEQGLGAEVVRFGSGVAFVRIGSRAR